MKKPARVWQVLQKATVPQAVLDQVNGHEQLAQALIRRGISDPQTIPGFLDPGKYIPFSPDEIVEVRTASEMIFKSIDKRDPILVWGDFDVDGQTSTTILVSTLRKLGANVAYHIPIRASESHGVNWDVLKGYGSSGIKLLITCDTGISAHAALDQARDQGMKIIVTDHHQIPSKIPDADCIINPQFWSKDHPLANLSGAGVAFILTRSVLENMGHSDYVDTLYDLTALGLIADLALLHQDVRYFVQRGLEKLRSPQRPAIQKLIGISEIDSKFLIEEHISFALAPRLNAIGRLDDANPVVEFLLSEDGSFLDEFSHKIETLNGKRKLLCEHVFQAALSQIESSRTLESDPILILSAPSWPAGVLGIVASRLVELFYRPVIILTTGKDGMAKGSARSIEGFDIHSAIAECDDLLLGFGGHPMAAGLSMKEQNMAEFRRRMHHLGAERMKNLSEIEALQIDDFLRLDDIQLETVETLEQLAPFGAGNPAPVFASVNLVIESASPIGKGKEHLLINIRDDHQNTRKIIWWQGVGNPIPDPETHFDLAYKIRASTFRGKPDIQIEWVDWRLTEIQTIELQPAFHFVITDRRKEANAFPQLRDLMAEPDHLVWGEGIDLPEITMIDRLHLQKAGTLIIATIPPGRTEIKNVLNIVLPDKIILYSLRSPLLSGQQYLSRVAGMWKYAISHDDFDHLIERMSAKLNTRTLLIDLCLRYLLSLKIIEIPERAKEHFSNFHSISSEQSGSFKKGIDQLINEINEFHKYYLRAAPEELF